MTIRTGDELEYDRTGIDLLYCLSKNYYGLGFGLAAGLIKDIKKQKHLNYALGEVEIKLAEGLEIVVYNDCHVDIERTFEDGNYSTGELNPFSWIDYERENINNRLPPVFFKEHLPDTIYTLALKCPSQVKEMVSLMKPNEVGDVLRAAQTKLTEKKDTLTAYNENSTVANPEGIGDDEVRRAVLAVNSALNERES